MQLSPPSNKVHKEIPDHDYCNAILYGATGCQIARPQRIQNHAARLITGTSKFHHITPILQQLHWLPVSDRIKFKIMLFVWKCLHSSAPVYLNNLLSIYHHESRLHKLDNATKLTPTICKKVVGQGAFGYSGPHLWNKLPTEIH